MRSGRLAWLPALTFSLAFCHLRSLPRRGLSARALTDVGAQELDAAVRSGAPVVLDVYAVWCGPCKLLEPALERLQQELNRDEEVAQVLRIDSDLHSAKATELGVEGLPTVIFFNRGAGLRSF